MATEEEYQIAAHQGLWRAEVLERLASNEAAIIASGGASGNPTTASPSGTKSTVSSTATGTVAAGSVFANIQNVGNADATVDGQTLPAGFSASYPTDGFLNPAIPWVATGTRLFITATFPPAP